MRILVVEDEIKLAHALKKGFEEQDFTVDLAFDGSEGLKLALKNTYNLIITDIIMPKLNGIEFCEECRSRSISAPFVMLTALGLTADKIKGFNAGTDDYIVKPFDFEELLVRVRAILNRTSRQTNSNSNEKRSMLYADLELDLNLKEVKRNGNSIPLTAKEYALLEYLVHNKERVVSKEELAENVWNLKFDTGTNFVEVYISYLRNKIDKNSMNKLIHTRKGLGYLLKSSN